MPIIDDDNRLRVVAMWKEGKSQNIISKELCLSRGAVQKIIKKFELYNSIKNLPRRGRPPKTTMRETLSCAFIEIPSKMVPCSSS